MNVAREQARRASPDAAVQVLERGNSYFFYRPRVGMERARGVADVQRLYVVLGPEAMAEIFRDLRIEKSLHPTTPLVEGKWV